MQAVCSQSVHNHFLCLVVSRVHVRELAVHGATRQPGALQPELVFSVCVFFDCAAELIQIVRLSASHFSLYLFFSSTELNVDLRPDWHVCANATRIKPER